MTTSKTIDEWEEAFKKADVDGDGLLSNSELSDMFRENQSKLHDRQIKQFLFVLDESYGNEKKISLGGFIISMKTLFSARDVMIAMFNEAGKDKNGFLTKSELKEIWMKCFPRFPPKAYEIIEIFRFTDKDQDGKVSLEESLTMLG